MPFRSRIMLLKIYKTDVICLVRFSSLSLLLELLLSLLQAKQKDLIFIFIEYAYKSLNSQSFFTQFKMTKIMGKSIYIIDNPTSKSLSFRLLLELLSDIDA